MDQYTNMVIIPVIHIKPMGSDIIIPFVIINLSTESTFLSKGDILGFLDQMDTEICEIMTSFAMEPSAEQPENQLP